MTYRRPKADAQDARTWKKWLAPHADTLHAIGVPSGAYATRTHWQEFIWTGAVNEGLRPISGSWSFEELPRAQMKALLEFLVGRAGNVPSDASLVSFLQARLQDPTTRADEGARAPSVIAAG